MFESRASRRARGCGHLLRRLTHVTLSILRAILVGAASFGPPRPPPEPPPPQTSEQDGESFSSQT